LLVESRGQGHPTETAGLLWYALRSKPRKEEVVARQAQRLGLEVFYPRLRVRPVNPRARRVLPYFPGYLFVQVDLGALSPQTFRWMPHAIGLVTFGEEPAPVPESLMHSLQKRLDVANEAQESFLFRLRRGDTVWIRQGPFEGYQGIFDTYISGRERVLVLLALLRNRPIAVELDAGSIDPTTRARA
jgi:transcriptional antiterminator RfaH